MTRVRPASGKRAAEAARHGLVKDRLGVKSSRPGESTAQPPLGYTFVPFGTPPLAERCKLMSKELQYPVFNVSVRCLLQARSLAIPRSTSITLLMYFAGRDQKQACE